MALILHAAEERIKITTESREIYQTFNPDSTEQELGNFGLLVSLSEIKMKPDPKKIEMEKLKNTEVVNLILSGKAEFFDSFGNTGIFGSDEIQVVAAGRGIFFGIHNYSDSDDLRYLEFQILPNQINLAPTNKKMPMNHSIEKNKFRLLISPGSDSDFVPINQNAFVFIGEFDAEKPISYASQDGNNGIYLFMISGKAQVGGMFIKEGDGLGITEFDKVEIMPSSDSKILVIEVPMI